MPGFTVPFLAVKNNTLGVQRPLNKWPKSEKTIILVGIYNQQFQGTIILMVFDFQGTDTMNTFPETNGPQKETIVFQPSILRGELLVSGRVHSLGSLEY